MSSALERIYAAALKIFVERGFGEISVSELADATGVSRGTIYNNLNSTQSLFDDIATELGAEMNERILRSAAPDADPVGRLADGIRLYIRRAHEEPLWGRFYVRYGLTSALLRELWTGPPMRDLQRGIAESRYDLRGIQPMTALSMIAGSVLGSMLLVLDGHKTWREAGTETAELLLRALGLPPDEARTLASKELAPLAPPR